MAGKYDPDGRETRPSAAENEGDFTCADFADFLQIKIDSYYNWINRQYNLGKDKERKFNGFLDDLLL